MTSVLSEPARVHVHAVYRGVPVVLRGRLCVLACGSMSNLPLRSGILPPQAWYHTVQATFEVCGLEGAEIFLGRAVAPGSFGYAVGSSFSSLRDDPGEGRSCGDHWPCGVTSLPFGASRCPSNARARGATDAGPEPVVDVAPSTAVGAGHSSRSVHCVAKVGLIHRGGAGHGYRHLLERSLAGRLGARLGPDIWRRIPMGGSRQSVAGRVVAVGDAAGQTKTTTGGGIYYAMLCARTLADVVLDSWRGADLEIASLRRYDRLWRRNLGREITAGLWLRAIFEHVEDDEVAHLLALASRPEVRDLMRREWNFDYHSRLMLSLLRLPEVRPRLLDIAVNRFKVRRVLNWIVGNRNHTSRVGA